MSVQTPDTDTAPIRSSGARQPLLLLLGLFSLVPYTSEAQIATGRYVGDGSVGRAITGVGFRPDVVLIKADYVDGAVANNSVAVMRTSTMAGDNTKPLRPLALSPNMIQSLDADGFTIGSDIRVNDAAVCAGPCTYYWVAFKANATMVVGTYTGNGTTLAVTGLPWSPDYVVVLPTTDDRAHNRASAQSFAPNLSVRFTPGGPFADTIPSIDANGFTVTQSASTQDELNTNGTTHHYVAWKTTPGIVKVGEYTGNNVDDRAINGAGFRPEVVLLAMYNDSQSTLLRTDQMIGDFTLPFEDNGLPNRVQNLLADGFEVGNYSGVNRAAGACAGSSDCHYFYVAFNAYGACCTPLTTTDADPLYKVTAPGAFELVFDKARGGGIRQFFDLAEDPARAYDLAGGASNQENLFLSEVNYGGNNHRTSQNTIDSSYAVIEKTPTRVKLRQRARYQRTTTLVPALKAIGDYTIYPSGRMALRWTRVADEAVTYGSEQIHLNVHARTAVAPFNGWAAYGESGPLTPGPANDRFLLAQSDVTGMRTDFLKILYQDWATAEQTDTSLNDGQEWLELAWHDLTGATMPAGSTEVLNFLTFFKPTNFLDNTDAAVVSRTNDYRSPDAPTVAVGAGWTDASENTSGADLFNESEGAYVFDLDPALGLTFDMNGAATTRHQPFFKIRHWRSLVPPSTITLEGSTLRRDIDYKADVKPFTRGTFLRNLLWHSTLQDMAAVTSPDVGTGGTVTAGVTFEAARFGQGARVPADADSISFPTSNNFDAAQGVMGFWMKPTYPSADGAAHDIAGFFVNASNAFLLQKGADDNLYFRIVTTAGTSQLTVNAANYSWAVGEWVYFELEWDEGAAVGNRMHLRFGDEEPPHTDPAVGYLSSNLTVGPNFYIGNIDNGSTDFSPGLYDAIEVTRTTVSIGDRLEDGGNNFALNFSPVDTRKRGKYLVLGTDSKFRGVNVALAVLGVGPADGALVWEYWDGSSWASLESVAGFTDQTNSLKKSGSVYWTADPPNWVPYSLVGGVEIYRIRTYLPNGSANYSTTPTEALIRPDLLLLQLCGDIAAAAQTIAIAPPVPTAVTLSSFEARGRDAAVDLSWTTASELRNMGFHLYRSEARDGPYTRVTSALITGLGSSPVGARYAFADGGLRNGTTYFYKLEDVETTGRTEQHGPVSATPQPVPGRDGDGDGPDGDDTGSDDAGGSTPGRMTYGDPDSSSLTVLERSADHVLLELRTGGFFATPDEGGTVRLAVPGFEDSSWPGLPAVPVRRAMVEAAVGRKVRLSVVARDLVTVPGLHPVSQGEPEAFVNARGIVKAGRRVAKLRRKAPGVFPPELGALSGVVFQGEVKKAQLELYPLRWAAGQVLLARRLLVRLEFFGSDPVERRRADGRGRRLRPRASHGADAGVAELLVGGRGLYRVRFEEVFGTATKAKAPLAASRLRLSRQGQPVAYHLEPNASTFGPGSSLFFWSEGAALNPHGGAVYRIEPGAPLVMAVDTLAARGVAVTDAFVRVEREENRFYQAGLLEAPSLWLWDLVVSPATKRYPFTVTALSPSTSAGRLSVWLQGASDFAAVVDHHVRLRLNGAYVGEVSWDGKSAQAVEADVPPGALREGANELEVENVGDAGAAYSMVFLDRFAVSYPRLLRAEAGRLEARFALSGRADVQGLAASTHVLDLTDAAPRWLKGGARTAAGYALRVQAGRRYAAVSADAVLRPQVRRPSPGTLKSAVNQADYLLLAPASFLPAAEPLLELRRSQGLSATGVALESVYQEFGYGETRPEAIKEFLEYAYQYWRRPSVRYVVLLGDASYDPKDYLKTGVEDVLPTPVVKTSYLWTASDPAYAAVNGEDLVPDVALGRLSASSVDEARVLVEKVLAFEGGGQDLLGRAVLVADNADMAGSFEADADEIASGVLSGRSVEKIYLRDLQGQTRGAILSAFDAGASLMSYVGHGGTAVWASENVLNNQDVSSLRAQSRQPLLMTMNCLNGFFHFPPASSLAEALTKVEGRGAIAAFSPSGLSVNEAAHVYHKALLGEIESGRHERLGDAILAAQSAYADSGAFPELLSIYHLLGDPALKIR